MVTADSYQSTDTLQLLKRLKFEIKEVSVDRTKGPYNSFKNAVYEERILLPDNPILKREMKGLRETQKKIDHPDDGGKDICDCIAAITYTLLELYHTQAIEYFSFTGIDPISRQMDRYEGITREEFGDDYGLINFEDRFGVDLYQVSGSSVEMS
jgi:hypothetical protein